MKCFHRLLLTDLDDRATAKQAGLGREHEHSSQEFLVVGTVVGWCLMLLPVPMPKGHQTPFIGRVVMLQANNRSVEFFRERFYSRLACAELHARMQPIVDSCGCHVSKQIASRDRGLVSSLPID